MRAIRDAREISLDAVIKATKAAPNVVEEFEKTALVDNPMYNRVYLRLFVRSYAEVLGIRSDDALQAVEQVLAGEYTDRMSRLYLEPPREEPVQSSGAPPEPSKEGESDASGSQGATQAEVAAQAPPGSPPARNADQEEARPPGRTPAKRAAATSKAAPVEAGGSGVREQSAVRDKAPILVSGSAPPTSSGPSVLIPRTSVLWRWGAGLLVFLLVVVVAVLVWRGMDSKTEEPLSPVAPDSVQAPEPVLPPRIVLGDTTVFSIVAVRDTLNPVRVTADFAWLEGRWMRLSAPQTRVWIELQDTLRLKATDQLELGNHGNDVDVLVHGIRVPVQAEAGGRLVLSKEAVQAHLDSLRLARQLPGA